MKLRIGIIALSLLAAGCGRAPRAPTRRAGASRPAARPLRPPAPDRATLPVWRPDGSVKAAAPVLVPQLGHAGGVGAVAFHPGGKLLASGSGDATVKLWEVSTGAEARSLVGHQGTVTSVAFSRDGSRLASGSTDATVILWEPQSGRRLRTLKRPTPDVEEVLSHYRVTSVAFSPDGRVLASGYGDGLIAIWETATGRLLRQWKGGDHVWGTAVSFNPDGKLLAANYSYWPQDGSAVSYYARLWAVDTGALVRSIAVAAYTTGCALSPDGRLLAAGGAVYDAVTGRQTCQLEGNGVRAATFSPDGSLVAGSWYEPKVTTTGGRQQGRHWTALWEARTGRLMRKLPGETSFGAQAAFSPDGALLAAGTGTQDVGLWEVRTGRTQRILAGRASLAKELAWSSAGSPLAVLTADGSLLFSDLRTGLTGRPGDRPDKIERVALSPDGDLFALAVGNRVELREVRTGRLMRTLSGHTRPVISLAFTGDGRLLASGSWDTTTRLWEVDTGRLLHELRGGGPAPTAFGATDAAGPRFALAGSSPVGGFRLITSGTVVAGVVSVAFSADGRTLATAAIHYAALWDVGTGRKLRNLASRFGTYSVAFSPDGKLLASGSWNGVIRLWRADSGEQMAESHGQQFDIGALVFSPDSHLLASGERNSAARAWPVPGGAIRLWRVPGGKLDGTLAGGPGLAFSPSGRLLAAGYPGGAIALWDMAARRALVTLHLFDGGREWIAVDDAGHYDCSAGAPCILAWRIGDAVFTSTELEAKLHRPGLLARAATSPP